MAAGDVEAPAEGGDGEAHAAAEYLQRMRIDDEEGYIALMHERSTDWGDEPMQPTARCVAHTIAILVRSMEEGSAGSDNFELTAAEVADWIKQHVASKRKRRGAVGG